MQSIVADGHAGVDLHQAQLCLEKLTDMAPRLALSRRMALAEYAKRLAPSTISKVSLAEALEAMRELEGKVLWPAHVPIEVLEKKLNALTDEVLEHTIVLSASRSTCRK